MDAGRGRKIQVNPSRVDASTSIDAARHREVPISALQAAAPFGMGPLSDHLVAALPVESRDLANLAQTQRRWRVLPWGPGVQWAAWERTALGTVPQSPQAQRWLRNRLAPETAAVLV